MAANGLPKPLKVGDKVVFIVKSNDCDYVKIGPQYRDTWLEGTVLGVYPRSITITHHAFPSSIAVWLVTANKGAMIVIRKVGHKLKRTGHLYKPSQTDKTLVVKSLRSN